MGVKKSISRTWYIFLAALTSAAIAHAGVPTKITYQGRVFKSGVAVTGSHTLNLTVVDANNTADRRSIAPINVTLPANGEFSVTFDLPPGYDWESKDPQLEVRVDGDLLTPSDGFGVTPYSLLASSVAANGVSTRSLQDGSVTNVKVSTVSASKIILPGGSTPISTWQLGAGNFIDASKVALPGSTATVASWQYGATGFIDVAKVTGTIPTTPAAHATSHGLVGTDPLINLSPMQLAGTAIVATSTTSQTIQPTADVIPLLIKPRGTVAANGINALEVQNTSSTTSFSVRGDGLITAKGTFNANGPVNATNGLTVVGTLSVSTIAPTGNLIVSGGVASSSINSSGGIVGTSITGSSLTINGTASTNNLTVSNQINSSSGVFSGDLRWRHIGARVYRTTGMSINSGVETKITFDAFRFDSSGMFGGNTTQLVIKKAGKYLVYANVSFSAHTDQGRQVAIKRNNAEYIAIETIKSNYANSQDTNISISTVYDFALNDYIELLAYQNSGATLTLRSAPAYTVEFGASYLGD